MERRQMLREKEKQRELKRREKEKQREHKRREKEKKKNQKLREKERKKNQLLKEREKKRDQLSSAAIMLFKKKGFEKTTIEDITLRANVATGTFYTFFEKKEDVVIHSFYRDIEKSHQEIEAIISSRIDFYDQLEAILSIYWKYIFRDKQLAKIVIKDRILDWGTRNNANELEFNKRLTRLIETAKQSNRINYNVDPRRLAKIIFALNTMYVVYWINGTIKSRQECLRQIKEDMKFIRHGIHNVGNK
jgi:AcrR family transcriptional regulator